MYKAIKWNCPHCNCKNVDSYQATVLPLCEQCLKYVDWYEILAQNYDYIIYVTEHKLYDKWDFQADPLYDTGLLYLWQSFIPGESIHKLTNQAIQIGERQKSHNRLLTVWIMEK